MWLNSNDFSNNYKQVLTVQDFTNFRSARSCGCQSSKIHIIGQVSPWWSATLLLALFECPHLHNLHWKVRFLYFSAFPFFLRRIPNSSTFEELPEKYRFEVLCVESIIFFSVVEQVDEFEIRRRKKGMQRSIRSELSNVNYVNSGIQIKRARK